MRKLLGLVLLLGLTGCGVELAAPQFYVKSDHGGYNVSLSGFPSSAQISRTFTTPREAQDLAERLNHEMEGNWPK